MKQVTETQELATKEPIYALVISWILLFPLLVFASGYGFSFELGAINTYSGEAFAMQGFSEMTFGKSLVLQIQAIVVYLICVFLMVPFVRIIAANFRRDILISSLTLLAIVSCIWSENPVKSLGYGILLIAGVAFAFYLLERFPAKVLMNLFLMVGAVAAIGSLFLIVFFPEYGLYDRAGIASGAWEGIFAHKNNCGEMMTYLLLPAFFVQLKSRSAKILRIAYIALVLLIIVMSRSAGAWVVCGSCLMFIAIIHLLVRMPGKDAAAIALVLVGGALIAGIVVYNYFDLLMVAIGKDPTMTGRTKIWSALMQSMMKRPLLGYGFKAFWQGLHGESGHVGLLMDWVGMGYAENGVIDLALELGAVGVALYLLVFCRAVKDAIYCFTREPSPGVMWYITLLFVLAISNIESGALLAPTDLKSLLPMVAFLGLRQEAQRLSSERVA
jgi:O-antigen ligase